MVERFSSVSPKIAGKGELRLEKDPCNKVLGMLDQLLCSSESDRSFLRQTVAGRAVYEILAEGYRLSMAGVAQDFRARAMDWQGAFAALEMPITLIRGAEDDIVSTAMCESLAATNPRARLVEIQGGRQFVESTPGTRTKTWQLIGTG